MQKNEIENIEKKINIRSKKIDDLLHQGLIKLVFIFILNEKLKYLNSI
jgi:hypothetical protein